MSAREVKALSVKADAVAAQEREVYLSFDEERAANEGLLRTALIAASPAIKALSSKIKGYETRGVAVGTAPPSPGDGSSGRVLYAFPAVEGNVGIAEGIIARGEIVSLAPVNIEDASSRYRAEQVLATLLRKCDEQLGGNSHLRGAQARERARRLRAVAVVVEAMLV